MRSLRTDTRSHAAAKLSHWVYYYFVFMVIAESRLTSYLIIILCLIFHLRLRLFLSLSSIFCFVHSCIHPLDRSSMVLAALKWMHTYNVAKSEPVIFSRQKFGSRRKGNSQSRVYIAIDYITSCVFFGMQRKYICTMNHIALGVIERNGVKKMKRKKSKCTIPKLKWCLLHWRNHKHIVSLEPNARYFHEKMIELNFSFANCFFFLFCALIIFDRP